MNDTVTCATTNAARIRWRLPLAVVCPVACFSASVICRLEEIAGTNPAKMPAMIEARTVNRRIGQSIFTSPARVVKRAANLTSNCRAGGAMRSPKAPPARASITASVNSWRISRSLLAPKALRTASSRSRLSTRASIRLATLAQAMSRTKPAAPSSTINVSRAR